MKERKPDVDRKEDTKGMPRKEQVVISRPRTGFYEGHPRSIHPFCNTYSTTYCGNAKEIRTRE
jgi:hypothetical protein